MGKKAARRAAVVEAGSSAVDKHTLYAQAVQSPKGDIDYLCRFHAQYMPPGAQAPLLLREDFSGTSELCAAWCASDPRRQAVGVDLDADELRYAVDTVLAAKVRVVALPPTGLSRLSWLTCLPDVHVLSRPELGQPHAAGAGQRAGRPC
jgi:hypothetical protein